MPKPRARTSAVAARKPSRSPLNSGASSSTQRAPGGPWAIASSSAVAERRDVVVRQLGARAQLQRHARARERRGDRATRAGTSPRIPRAQQVAHVRRDGHKRRAVRDREPGELDRLVEVDRAVVDAREQVEVELGALQGPLP